METILVIDDNTENLVLAQKALEGLYQLALFTSGQAAVDYLRCLPQEGLPDLMLLDIYMPRMDGCQTLAAIRRLPGTEAIPAIFYNATNDPKVELEGLELGAVEFAQEPFVPQSMLLRIRNHLELVQLRQELERISIVQSSKSEEAQDAMVERMTRLVECRDRQTGGHSRRVAQYTWLLMEALRQREKYAQVLTPQYMVQVKRGAYLHDIGKIGIADNTLLKDSRLDDQEMAYMQKHTTFGGKALDRAMKMIPGENFLSFARDLAYCHHEKWDGTGYPMGLAGEEIPLSARILTVADVYDALTSRRPYKAPIPHSQAVEMILSQKGTAFDPTILEVFREIQGQFGQALECYLAEEGQK